MFYEKNTQAEIKCVKLFTVKELYLIRYLKKKKKDFHMLLLLRSFKIFYLKFKHLLPIF
jgi:hypothetical protein